MALVFAVMHLHNILEFFIASVHSFFILFKNLVLINQRTSPRYQHVLVLCTFLALMIPKRLNSSKNLYSMFVHVLFYVNLCTRLVLWFLNNL